MAGSESGDAEDQLAEEVAAGHDLVGLGGVGQLERLANDAAQAPVVDHVEHRGEAAAAWFGPPAAA